MGILNIENVSKSFGSRRVLDSVSLSLERGETLALIPNTNLNYAILPRN